MRVWGKKLLLAGAATLTATMSSAPAQATIILVDASSIQGANVLFNSGTQTGTTVTGLTNDGLNEVVFTGTTVGGGTTIRANGGQARIEGALDTSTGQPNDTLLLSSLDFGLGDMRTFNNLELNLFGGPDGTATAANFTLTDNMGQVFNFNNVALGNGSNFFGFQGIDGQSISNASFTLVGGGIADVRQIRLDAGVMSAVPEPATWAMMLIGFGAVGHSMRASRRTNKGLAIA